MNICIPWWICLPNFASKVHVLRNRRKTWWSLGRRMRPPRRSTFIPSWRFSMVKLIPGSLHARTQSFSFRTSKSFRRMPSFIIFVTSPTVTVGFFGVIIISSDMFNMTFGCFNEMVVDKLGKLIIFIKMVSNNYLPFNQRLVSVIIVNANNITDLQSTKIIDNFTDNEVDSVLCTNIFRRLKKLLFNKTKVFLLKQKYINNFQF